MRSLPPEYLAEVIRQILFVSAFLGGVSATFLASLLFLKSAHKFAGWTIAGASFAASAFMVAVFALTFLVVTLHPNAPTDVFTNSSTLSGRIVGLLAFVLGSYALLLSIGLSGWLRSRKTGIATSCSAGLAALLCTWAIMGF